MQKWYIETFDIVFSDQLVISACFVTELAICAKRQQAFVIGTLEPGCRH